MGSRELRPQVQLKIFMVVLLDTSLAGDRCGNPQQGLKSKCVCVWGTSADQMMTLGKAVIPAFRADCGNCL